MIDFLDRAQVERIEREINKEKFHNGEFPVESESETEEGLTIRGPGFSFPARSATNYFCDTANRLTNGRYGFALKLINFIGGSIETGIATEQILSGQNDNHSAPTNPEPDDNHQTHTKPEPDGKTDTNQSYATEPEEKEIDPSNLVSNLCEAFWAGELVSSTTRKKKVTIDF